MKVRSALLTEMSGKIGGAVASRARGGIQYFRALVTPSNPRSFLQTAMRNGVTSASAAWLSVLTELQQQLWWDLADTLGSGATGKTLFSKVNQARYYAENAARIWNNDDAVVWDTGLEKIVDPPATISVASGGQGVCVIDDSANTINIPKLTSGASVWLEDADSLGPALQFVYVSAGQTASRFSRAHPYQLVSVEAYNSTDPDDSTAHNVNLAALGLPTITGYVMYVKRYVQTNDGRISTPVEERITITA